MAISYQDQKNFNQYQKIQWFDYGINENDLTLDYYEIQKIYTDNLVLIQMYFIYPKLLPEIKRDVDLSKVFKLLKKDSLTKLNPYLLLLGYWVNLSPPNDRKKRFEGAFKDMKKIWKNYNVEPEDLVRYYNFWKQKK